MIGSEGQERELLRPLVNQWLEKIAVSRKSVHRETFNNVADQCRQFFSGAPGFMWDDKYKKQFMGGGIAAPKFKVTLNKAFELVAIFGPYLFWQYPHRHVQSFEPVELTPELFGDPNDEYVQQVFGQIMAEEAADRARGRVRNSLMERYLNYSQREQPGGLACHAELAITEALITGRGCLWVQGVDFAGSGRQLTGCFFDSVDNLHVDPDCTDPTLRSAKWIAREHWTATWELERMMGLPRGSIKKAQGETHNSVAVNNGDDSHNERANGRTNDMVRWFEVWSKNGVGSRMRFSGDSLDFRMNNELHEAFDKVVGDYAYLCVTEGVPWPLNLPGPRLAEMSNEEIADRLEWRAANYGPKFPTYTDERWPVACLDFYKNPQSAWPIAPLSPGLGELTVMNILASAIAEQGYENRKLIIAYLEEHAKTVKAAITSNESPCLVPIGSTAQQRVDDIIQYLKRPEMNTDILKAFDYLAVQFDKRTGLSEFMYAMNAGGVASRTARDVAAKEEKASIRPEKMSNDVGAWMTEASRLEKFLAGWTVTGEDVRPLLGRFGARLWDDLIANEDPELIVREMTATVEASDIRKPNKERLAANVQQMLQSVMPVYQQYAADTGDTRPLNEFLNTFGEAIEQDVSGWALGEWRPEPSEEQQQAAQMEMAKQEAEVQKRQLEVEIKSLDMQRSIAEAQREAQQGNFDAAGKQLEFLFSTAKHEQDMGHDDERFDQELTQDRVKFLQELGQRRIEGAAKVDQMRRESLAKNNGSAA